MLIHTGSTYERIADSMAKRGRWATLPFANGKPGLTVAFETGMGDGIYPVYGLFRGDKLIGIELDFQETSS